jgi:hypothetical protein
MANVNDSGGVNTDPGGEGEKSKSETVSREAYNKTLTNEKNLRKERDALAAKVAEFETSLQTDAEAKLIAEKKYVDVIEQQKKQIAELTGKTQTLLQDATDSRKLTSFLSLIQEKGVQVEAKYFNLVPIDSIQFSQDGTIDHTSVAEAVSNFQKEHPKLLGQSTTFPPNSKTGGTVGKKMSMDEWKKLPLKDKEKAWKEGKVEKPAILSRGK